MYSARCGAARSSSVSREARALLHPEKFPARFDGTLWALFMTGLAVTFACYRLAGALGRKEASALGAPSSGPIDARLVLGAALFGLGWGLGGVCPGPHIVSLGANPMQAPGLWLMLLCVGGGMRLAPVVAAVL